MTLFDSQGKERRDDNKAAGSESDPQAEYMVKQTAKRKEKQECAEGAETFRRRVPRTGGGDAEGDDP